MNRKQNKPKKIETKPKTIKYNLETKSEVYELLKNYKILI